MADTLIGPKGLRLILFFPRLGRTGVNQELMLLEPDVIEESMIVLVLDS